MVQEISIVLQYEKRADGSYFIQSESLPGFLLEGPDIDALQRDLDPIVTDLLAHNMGFEVESMRWIPSPQDVKDHLNHPSETGTATYVAQVKVAA